MVKATRENMQQVVLLFDAYRVFYGKTSDLDGAKCFIEDRLQKEDAIIVLAIDSQNHEAMGFAQIYPSFSSIAMRSIHILNDLFVAPIYRNKGVGQSLLDEVKRISLEKKVAKIVLQTAVTNHAAQYLYCSQGYKKVTDFEHYYLDLTSLY